MTDQEAGVRGYLASVAHSRRIPAGTPVRPCKVCPAGIYFVDGLPLSVDSYKGGPAGYHPTSTEDGAGIHHRATCPNQAKIPVKARGGRRG